jgi:hypothetical protein
MPRFRITVRRMMVAVAVVAILLGAIDLYRRRAYYLENVNVHSQVAETYADLGARLAGERSRWFEPIETLPDGTSVKIVGEGPDRQVFYPPQSATPLGEAEAASLAARCKREAESYGRDARRYERAARYPWLPLAPRPPDPK